MNPRRIMIGTAGHVDHGKTSLVKHLTGFETDTLNEEKARGLSINLGFAPCFLNDDLVAGLVDVPGHEKFIRNMIAGATGLDLVLLVVAADDGIMPQTREHLFILDRLGIKRGLIAINKIDLVDEETRELVKLEIEELTEGTFLENAPMIEVSAVSGEGCDALKNTLAEIAQQTPAKKTKGFFRLPIQRVFSKEGIGCIVTGVPFAGHITLGEELEVLPQQLSCRVRSIQAYGKDAHEAQAGHSVALNLAGIDYNQLHRGDVICSKGYFDLSHILNVMYIPLPQTKWPKNHSEVAIYLGTKTVRGKIIWLDDQDNQGTLAQLRLNEGVVIAPGDRFLIRDASLQFTLGGGPIINSSDNKISKKHVKIIEHHKETAAHLDQIDTQIVSALTQNTTMTTRELEKKVLLPISDLKDFLNTLKREKKINQLHDHWFLIEAVNQIVNDLKIFMEKHYQAHSQKRWISLSVIKENFGDVQLELARQSSLFHKTFRLGEKRICLFNRLVPLTKIQRQWADKLIKALDQGQFTPPLPEEVFQGIPSNNKPKDILKALVDNQEIIKLSDKVYWNHDTFEKACDVITSLGQEHKIIEIKHIKDSLGLSRKFAIPLLELTDKTGLTRRVEGGRQLVKKLIT